MNLPESALTAYFRIWFLVVVSQAGDGEKDIPVGKVIAMLAEEGDDISNVEAPKEGQKQSSSSEPPREEKESSASSSSSSSSSPTESNRAPSSPTSKTSSSTAQHSPSSSKESEDFIPAHPHPLSPSVLTLLIANGIKDASDIKGTGKNGMLIKGDVLVALGKIKDPMGSARKLVKEGGEKESEAKKAEKKVDTVSQVLFSFPGIRLSLIHCFPSRTRSLLTT